MDIKNRIAYRIAQELETGELINLGIGIPTLIANHVPKGVEVTFQAENGIIGVGPTPEVPDPNLVNPGGAPLSVLPGASFFDSSRSFAIIRGGHVDMTILGAMQVDEEGNLANWMIPSKKVSGIGGAMDLVVGAKKVIVAMEHTQKGRHKILKKCTFPLTALKSVDEIVTEMCVLTFKPEGLTLTELAPDYTVEQVKEATECDFIVSPNLKVMNVGIY